MNRESIWKIILGICGVVLCLFGIISLIFTLSLFFPFGKLASQQLLMILFLLFLVPFVHIFIGVSFLRLRINVIRISVVYFLILIFLSSIFLRHIPNPLIAAINYFYIGVSLISILCMVNRKRFFVIIFTGVLIFLLSFGIINNRVQYKQRAGKVTALLNLIQAKQTNKAYSLFVISGPFFVKTQETLEAEKRYVTEGLAIIVKHLGSLETYKLEKVSAIDTQQSYGRGKLEHIELTTLQGTGFMSEVYLFQYKAYFSNVGWVKLVVDLRKYSGSDKLEIGAIEIHCLQQSEEANMVFEKIKKEINDLRKQVYDSTGIGFCSYRPLTH